ncbi:OLC1v1031267C1 [Oldenlandia corymbosa var. corymbosa]|uniref:RING-type E3 ubiquitin transferase n=1 Tax=Oldenlandia corymbosa var. corymbosa TaxID=529605 RepID=A0AAV1CLA3_OLDCO|nr:OLC1v1031267C1 [Oldenlandia corymbosa var. corymbosa]
MGSNSMVNPKPWVPYMNTKDCSQGFCSIYCPQWCYIIFPPPPSFELNDDSAGPSFSPIVIAIIGILASAFLLVSYYAIISKYCKDRTRESHFPSGESEAGNLDHSIHSPWHDLEQDGLDEALIKSIKVFKYKKGDHEVNSPTERSSTECSVCLSEFQDGESLRLLPKCSHGFHVMCIDTWLRSHSNCPLCRANIAVLNADVPPLTESSPPQNGLSSVNGNSHEIENVHSHSEADIEMGIRSEEDNVLPGSRANNDHHHHHLGNSSTGDDSRLSDLIRNDEDREEGRIRRSVSMDCISPGRLSIADMLRMDQDEEDDQTEQNKLRNEVGTSKWRLVGMNRPGNITRTLQQYISSGPIIKTSFSSERFLFSMGRRGRNLDLPP